MSASQVERVLALLRSRGESGVNTASLQELPTLDGGAPVLRLAARIQQLKDRGFAISSRREANRTSTYRLLAEPGVERAVGKSPVENVLVSRTSADGGPPPDGSLSTDDSLFDTSAFTERGGYRDTERAA